MQIQIPVGVFVLAPVGGDDQVDAIVEEIGDGNHARLSRLAAGGFEEQDGLFAEPASDPSAAEADEEGVDVHEPFDEGVVHFSTNFFNSSSPKRKLDIHKFHKVIFSQNTNAISLPNKFFGFSVFGTFFMTSKSSNILVSNNQDRCGLRN